MSRQKWEYASRVYGYGKYSTLPGDAEQDLLNELGDQGWELVNVSPIGDYGYSRLYVFKRPRRD